MTNILELPTEVLANILRRLTLEGLYWIGQTCHALRNVARDKVIIHEHYNKSVARLRSIRRSTPVKQIRGYFNHGRSSIGGREWIVGKPPEYWRWNSIPVDWPSYRTMMMENALYRDRTREIHDNPKGWSVVRLLWESWEAQLRSLGRTMVIHKWLPSKTNQLLPECSICQAAGKMFRPGPRETEFMLGLMRLELEWRDADLRKRNLIMDFLWKPRTSLEVQLQPSLPPQMDSLLSQVGGKLKIIGRHFNSRTLGGIHSETLIISGPLKEAYNECGYQDRYAVRLGWQETRILKQLLEKRVRTLMICPAVKPRWKVLLAYKGNGVCDTIRVRGNMRFAVFKRWTEWTDKCGWNYMIMWTDSEEDNENPYLGRHRRINMNIDLIMVKPGSKWIGLHEHAMVMRGPSGDESGETFLSYMMGWVRHTTRIADF